MIHTLLVVIVIVVLLLILGISIVMGRYAGHLQLKQHPAHKLEILSVAEGSVFGLLALLIAFTFSGAYDRFEKRKLHILDEASAFERVYEYTDFMPSKYQPTLRAGIREYLDLHLLSYNDIPYLTKVQQDLDQARQLQNELWKITTIAYKENSNSSLAQIFAQAMADMFDAAQTGANLTRIHPPAVIFILLIGLAALGAFLVGYNSVETKQRLPIHVICYLLLTAFTIYVIINLEFPRTGFINLRFFDHVLIEVRNNMH